jgi:hypothetical protein
MSSTEAVPGGSAYHTDIEVQIQDAEAALGITTDVARLQEASLFIDAAFLEVAAVTGQHHPERAFGHQEWLGHLVARQVVRAYGDQPLTLDFMLAIHRAHSVLSVTGIYEQLSFDRPWPRGGNYNAAGEFRPMRLDNYQIAALRANRHADFLPDPKACSPNQGYITYPTMQRTPLVIALRGICDWYNAAKMEWHDSVDLAAALQRQVVSLHPFAGGISGRSSRALMNWSLENCGLPPSAPADFEADVLSSATDWSRAVARGIKKYQRMGRLAAAGTVHPVVLLGVTAERDLYADVLQHRIAAPLPLTAGAWHDKGAYNAFRLALQRPERRKDDTCAETR